MQKSNKTKYDLRYLKLLSKEYPNIQSACTEIINLQAILNLPKGTEHFMSDIHGEDEAFVHILNNASGVIREKVDDIFANRLTSKERNSLCALIYYPERKLSELSAQHEDVAEWYEVILYRLIDICREVTSKYTRSKVRKALPKDFEYIIDELLNTNYSDKNKEKYYENIIKTIIDIQRADEFIIALCNLIKRMAVDRLHIVGDIFDRGPHPDVILDRLMEHHSVDIQWGNHDALWMGAASGSAECIATVLNNCMKYDNLDVIEDGYGINLLPLALFAAQTYEEAERFRPRSISLDSSYDTKDIEMLSRMHKAICIIQFKLEGQLIARRPEFLMDDRDMLSRIDYDNMSITIDGNEHFLTDCDFPTIDPAHPLELTDEESALINQLVHAFKHSEKLQKHVNFLLTAGSLYRCFNDNLMFHGCVPLNDDGSFMELKVNGMGFKGKELFDHLDKTVRRAFLPDEKSAQKKYGQDLLWFLWCGRNSPLFGRDHITTFERYFIPDKETHVEKKNAYYKYYNDSAFCTQLLAHFGIENEQARIINGHIPVKVRDGEGPLKANGKLIVIDGGFCKAYQSVTGIAGYTMFFSSHGIRIAAHQPWCGLEESLKANTDITSETVLRDDYPERILVGQTDTGKELKESIDELEELLKAYRTGVLPQVFKK